MTKDRKEAEILTHIATKAIQDKKGKDITIIDFDGVKGSLFDYYVICTANSPSHVDSIQDNIEQEIKKATKLSPNKVEGLRNCQWVLLDYFNVIVHIFLKETREFYNIESMWKDIKQTHLKDEE
jgi:ribosome-associated protein